MLSVLKLKCKIGLRYRKYLFWQCCTNIISGTESVIATHSMFDALSIGKTETDVCSLTFNLMGKEIIGQIFGIPIINKMSKMGDENVKKFILINTIIFETSNLLECLTPFLDRTYFIYFASIANIGKGSSFVGIGGINAKVINRISIDLNNINSENMLKKDKTCELYSKTNIVISLSYSFGMILGLGIVKLIPCSYTRISLIPVFGIARYYTSLNAVNDIIHS